MKANSKILDLINKMTYRVEWSEEDETHIAYALEMPSIKAHSKTPEGAVKEVKQPLEAALQMLIEEGRKLPEPIAVQKYKGNVSLRTTPERHRQLAMEAAESNVSINQYILSKLG